LSETQRLIMLPGPTNVPPRVMRAMLKPLIGHRGPEFKQLMTRVLTKTKKVFETKKDLFILTTSGTGATECALQNIIDDGDKIIVNVTGFFSERLAEAAQRYGGNPVTINSEWGKAPRTEDFRKALKANPDTKAVAVVYNETSTGVTVRSLQEIGKLCAEQNVLFIVDAISILGGDKLPVDDWNVDMCVTASQKCLMCPPGLSFVSVSERAWEKIESKKHQRSFYLDLPMYRKFMETGYTPFTPAVSLFYALDESCDMILEEGLQARYDRHRICAEAVYNSMEALGLNLMAEPESRSHTVAAVCCPPGVDDGKLRELIRVKYGIDLGGSLEKWNGKMFRIGIMGAVGSPEIMSTVSAIASASHDLGFKANISESLEAARKTLSRLPSRVN
jgi:aspartate aminotransferase-like enzyme